MTTLEALPPLREVVRSLAIEPRRALGQNFLFDLNLTRRIARAGGPLPGHTIVEIGSGPGGLTRALLMEGADHVVAVERDGRCLPALADVAAAAPGRLTVMEADALDLSMDEILARAGRRGPVRIVANLPYNVGTALLTSWMTVPDWPPPWSSATLMFQREVADRIIATKEAPSDYGRLGVLCGWRTAATLLFDVAATNFVPPPKVTSAIARVEPRPRPLPCRLAALETVTRAAFGQRRKMLRQSLRSLGKDPLPIIAAAGLPATARPETIDIAGFINLANAFEAAQSRSSAD